MSNQDKELIRHEISKDTPQILEDYKHYGLRKFTIIGIYDSEIPSAFNISSIAYMLKSLMDARLPQDFIKEDSKLTIFVSDNYSQENIVDYFKKTIIDYLQSLKNHHAHIIRQGYYIHEDDEDYTRNPLPEKVEIKIDNLDGEKPFVFIFEYVPILKQMLIEIKKEQLLEARKQLRKAHHNIEALENEIIKLEKTSKKTVKPDNKNLL